MSAADGHSVYTASAPLPRKRSMNSPSTLESPTNDSPGDNKDTQDLNDGDAGVHINTSQLEYSPNSYSTPETRPCHGTKEVTHDHSVEDNSSPYNDRVHLLRLLPDMLPLGLQNRTSKMSEATRFHHWPTVLYSNVEELMSDLSPSEQNIFRTQRGHILHPFSGAKMFARLFSGRDSLNILGLECTSLDDMKNDGTDDIINFENIGGWEASADSLINNRSLVGGGVSDHALQFKKAVKDALNYAGYDRCDEPDTETKHDGDDDLRSCESETEVVEGVENKSSALQSSSDPPANLSSTKSKGKGRRLPTKKNGKSKNRGKKRSENVLANNKKANKEEHGSRVIINHSLPVLPGVPNDRTCVLDSLCAHIGDPTIKQAVISSFFQMMPKHGDTPIDIANDVLDCHKMVLQRATPNFQGGCMAFNLLRVKKCRLIISVLLYDLKEPTWCAPHCIAWDGDTVHDRPKSVQVNNTSDRTPANSKAVFERLFHKKKYSRWQIVHVYELRDSHN